MGALKDAARKGKGGDTRLGHLTNGDVVFPAERLDEPTRALVFEIMKAKGVKDPHRFQVGHLNNLKNPKTRLPMFAEGGGTGAGGGDSGSDSGGGGAASSGNNSNTADNPGTGSPSPAGIGAAAPEGGAPAAAAPAPPSSNLTGLESATAVESGQIPGTPNGQLSATDAAAMGQLGKAFAPDLGILGNTLGNVLGNVDTALNNNSVSQTISEFNDPIGTIAGMGINGLLGLGIPGFGLGRAVVNTGLSMAGLPGINPGQAAVQGLEGLVGGHGLAQGAENASAGTPGGMTGGLGTGGPGDPNKDTGAGLRALGGGVGVNLDEMLKNRLGSSVNG